jgi:hypothetical protein
VHESRPTSRRSLDEGGQPTGRDDAPRVDEPERERGREHGKRKQDDEPADPIASSAVPGRRFARASGPPIEAIARPMKSSGEKPLVLG